MGYLIDVDWASLFRPQMSLLEVLIRGVVVYVTLCLLLRIILKRQAGQIALADLLVVTIIGGVCRNSLVRDAYSIPDTLGVVAVVLGLSYLLDFLSYYVPRVHALLHPTPVVLVRNGQIEKENLRRELITEPQLLSQLRQHGLESPAQAATVVLEGSGHVSVIVGTAQPCATDRLRAAPPSDNLENRDVKVAADVAWHEEQIRKHQAAAAALKDLLTADRGSGTQRP